MDLKKVFCIPDYAMIGFDSKFNPNHFFFEVDCFLKEWREPSKLLMAGNIINSFCADKNINQRLILVTLQRESGMLSYKTKEEAMTKVNDAGQPIIDFCCCVGLPDDWTKINLKYQGFFNQIKGACDTYKWWFVNARVGREKEMVNEPNVIPENAATYSLLMYCPHVGGLELTRKLYDQYFPGYIK